MAEIVRYVTGDMVGTYASLSTPGNDNNGNGMKVTLDGVEPLGTSSDIFRIVIRQVNTGDTQFSNGQFVDIYAYPDSDPPADPIYSSLNPQDDQFQGRASSADHQIFTQPENIVFDLNGVTAGSRQYGPGANPPRDEKLSFESFSDDPPVFPCFTAGTLIDTSTGRRPIEAILPGDLLWTLDHGLQPVDWVGRRTVPGLGQMAPIEIAAGALGNRRKLVVSPQHRMLVCDWRTELYFGQPQVLVAAAHLVNGTTIRQVPHKRVSYVHVAFERHMVIFGEGIPSESLHLGAMALRTMNPAQRAEIEALFPEFARLDTAERPRDVRTARLCLRRWEAFLVA